MLTTPLCAELSQNVALEHDGQLLGQRMSWYYHFLFLSLPTSDWFRYSCTSKPKIIGLVHNYSGNASCLPRNCLPF